ncbi:uncharacterized protein MAM_05824 [Metarhizium album ARSEF 1941]|uniref:Uncharacterized protein n=1 Tax=Metarhizium album (strain ARSEF 1941) TaxID=1081103 RepID=A0A0B2WQF4_METAS|nr:uncharacterized protein MAM_05824 [Metarhizium album ARSEF 1941]KHN96238.1 hypothetical protein MAM_05824 [Metarhizium album ARSEF 1941]
MLSLRTAAASPPVGGRSRYSKALPSVPVDDSQRVADLPPLPLPKDLSEFQFPLPPRKSSRGTDTSKSIPRKPVGSSSSKPAAPPSVSPSINSPTSSPSASKPVVGKAATAITRAPEPPVSLQAQPLRAVAPPELSPTDSICSLLSAYSREPDAPMSGSTYTTASKVNSLHDSNRSPPPLGNDGLSAGGHAYSQTPTSAVEGEQSSEHKDQSRPAPSLTQDDASCPTWSPPPEPLPVAPPPDKTLPPRLKIWKRRPQTAEKNKELPDLKLSYSHGSTASTSTIQSIETAVLLAYPNNVASEYKPTEEDKQDPTPRTPAVGLPGRNIKPASGDKSQVTEEQMGSVVSKMQRVVGKVQNPRTPVERKNLPTRGDSKRPPTPEYRKGDGPPSSQADIVVLKPASPVSTTGSPKEGVLTVTPKWLPSQPIAPLRSQPVPPSFVSIPPIAPTSTTKRLPQAAPDLRLATTLLEQKRNSPSPSKEGSPTAASQSPPVNDSNRGTSASSLSESSCISSGQNDVTGHSAGEPQRPATANDSSDPRIVTSDTHGPMYRGRDGTLYGEMKVVQEPNPRAAYFPIQTDKPLPPGAIIPSRPLNRTHYNCFQKHRTMNRRSNRNHPLTCQTCDKADTEDRWGLNGHQKALGRNGGHVLSPTDPLLAETNDAARRRSRRSIAKRLPEPTAADEAIDAPSVRSHHKHHHHDDGQSTFTKHQARLDGAPTPGLAAHKGKRGACAGYTNRNRNGREADDPPPAAEHCQPSSGQEPAHVRGQRECPARPDSRSCQEHGGDEPRAGAPNGPQSQRSRRPRPTGRLGSRFEQLARESGSVSERERLAVESDNILALRRWARSGRCGVEERTRWLGEIFTGLWTLGEPAGRHARVVKRFERWAARVCDAEEARRDAGSAAVLHGHDSLFVGELGAAWNRECVALTRRLETWRARLADMDDLPASDASSLGRMLAGATSLVCDMLAELRAMAEIEQEALAREDAWIERVNRAGDDDDDGGGMHTPRAGAVWRVI